MKLIRAISCNALKAAVATIGNFDGVHLGHQRLLAELKKLAVSKKLPMVVLLFEPQPSELLLGKQAPIRLNSLREKLDALSQYNVDYVYCLKFDKILSLMPATKFAAHYFFSLLNVKYLLVGEDFHFGQQREGDVHLLRYMGRAAQCEVAVLPHIKINMQRVSSTRIRTALLHGNLNLAAQLLGRPYSLCGRIIKGNGKGRQWGIPTANFKRLPPTLSMTGVFCVCVQRSNNLLYKGVANLGIRPTIDGSSARLEVHLFDFDGNLYGEILKVFFLHKLREEIKFTSQDALIAQIRQDIAAAIVYLNQVDINCLKNHQNTMVC